MEFSSRMKDYYDIYYLAEKFDFDGATLTEALQKIFKNREHNFTAEQFEQVMAFDNDEAMQKKWKAFVRIMTNFISFSSSNKESQRKSISAFMRWLLSFSVHRLQFQC